MNADLVLLAAGLHGVAGSALAVRNGRIMAIGTRRDASTWSGPSTTTLDLGEAHLLPGLTDAHSHPFTGAQLGRGLDLQRVSGIDELRRILEEESRRLEPGEWLLGWGLQHSLWPGRPDAALIRDAVGQHPLLLRFFDAHSALSNDVALHLAGIRDDADMPNGGHLPGGGRVVVDSDGAPTGLLQEPEAVSLISRHLPEETLAQQARRLKEVLDAMSRSGLTGVHAMDAEDSAFECYQALDDSGLLPVRVKVYPWVTPQSTEQDWQDLGDAMGTGGVLWKIHGVKIFLDGTIDDGTAWLTEPDCRGQSQSSTWRPVAKYRAALEYFSRAGVNTATHAIGDAAVTYASAVIASLPRSGPQHRIEHLEFTNDALVAQVASSGAVASMQPLHCSRFVDPSGADSWSQRLGPQRAQDGWRLRSLVDHKTPLALGSDWPVAPFAPLPTLAEAQTRWGEGFSAPVLANERLTAAQALAGYTAGAAVAAGTQAEEGFIGVGARADLTALNVDPLRVPPEELAHATVISTIVDGRPRYLP